MSAHGEGNSRGISLVTKARRERALIMRSRGVEPPAEQVPAGRFGRIFEELPKYEPGNAALNRLARTMKEDDSNTSDDSAIPLGFAFLGQFIDHDITFDPVSKLDERLDPEAVRNFRTPALDLDNVYGEGPEASRFLYDTVGRNASSEHRSPFRLLTGTEKNEMDLPRNRQGTALIGDPRNDENLLVSQVHAAFLRFHNEVVKYVEHKEADNPLSNGELFEEARKEVTLHYNWIVVHEYLPLIVGEEMAEDVLVNGRQFYKWEERSDRPFIPVEFSGAAYRFGHSQIRTEYNLNDSRQGIDLFELPFFGLCPEGDCEAGPSEAYNLDWPYYFDLGSDNLQFCRNIDSLISETLFELPFVNRQQGGLVSLPERNMRRARTLQLPAGQDVAQAMGITPLTNADMGVASIRGLGNKVPLWYYILKEAEMLASGRHLGPVGGRIVAETLVALSEVVQSMFLLPEEMADWTPTLPNRSGTVGTFTMADLVTFQAHSSNSGVDIHLPVIHA